MDNEEKKLEEKLEEDLKVESGKEEGSGNNNPYIDAINEMRKKYVPKQQLDDAKAENKKLLTALVEGKTLEAPKQEEQVNIEELRKKIFNSNNDLSNLEYVESVLKLRKALIARGERDPFLPVGSQVDLTSEHYEKAKKIAEGLQHCVDFAEGDSGIFTAEYQRIVKDPVLPGLTAKRIRR